MWNLLLESIQGICKHPTYRFEDTIVWERWHFWRSEINIDYRLIQYIKALCWSPLPIFKLSLQVPWIDSNRGYGFHLKYRNGAWPCVVKWEKGKMCCNLILFSSIPYEWWGNVVEGCLVNWMFLGQFGKEIVFFSWDTHFMWIYKSLKTRFWADYIRENDQCCIVIIVSKK